MSQVRALKEMIESEKGQDAYPIAGQKLIYAGFLVLFLFFCPKSWFLVECVLAGRSLFKFVLIV